MTKTIPILSGYDLVEKLQHSSDSVVYRAKQGGKDFADTPRSVIIKLLPVKYPSYQELINFRHQYTIAKDLDIPGVLRLYHLEEHDRGYALVMEDYGGIALDQYPEPLSLPDVLEIAIQLTSTLQLLGKQNIIHKNINPSNLLINPNTKQIKLIDFSIASLLPRETQIIVNPDLLEGNLSYISPEQTGRMNRGIDYRSDFYSLGITLYELLTGRLPFVTTNPIASGVTCGEVWSEATSNPCVAGREAIELVHCHLSQIAVPANLVNPEIPAVVAQIVAKLMAKNAEDRYQSALGIQHDLANCLHQWLSINTINEFELAQQDFSDRFILPEKLYGRTAELRTLLDAFQRVSQGHTEMMLVAGFSGIGKTAVINEIHKPIIRQKGYFIKGKYDQFNRRRPFSGFFQAFRDLIKQLLSESTEQIADWKSQILAAVGENAQVLINELPELKQLIGSQQPIRDIEGTASQQRFNLAFQKFIEVFTTAEHPLVIFLDDLQWADAASLKLMKLLMTGKGYLLLLGAYRDNEVSSTHQFILKIEQLKQAAVAVQTISLAPLNLADTNQLIADTLHCTIERTESLAELVDRKTQGNPFFVTQFLKSLYADGQIRFNRRGYWECDLAQIQSLSVTDDVVELMADQLQRLPIAAQQIFKLAACIGNQFDLETLVIISEQSRLIVTDALWEGLQSGLILPTSQVYKFFQSDTSQEFASEKRVNSTYQFLHDRVQQAAYSLIPDRQKQQTHLEIGRLLLANASNEQRREKLFEIVNHFNLAIELVQKPSEREMLTRLNLKAAQKAQVATAYSAAYNYAQVGIKLLSNWSEQYNLALTLHETLAEVAFLNGDFAAVPALTKIVLKQARSTIDRIKTYELIIQFHTIQKQHQQAIDSGLEVLQQLGINVGSHPHKLDLFQELIKTKIALGQKTPEDLLNLPEMVLPEKVAALKILDLLQMPAYLFSQKLLVVLAAVGVRTTLQHGNNPLAASFYAHYSMVLSSAGDLDKSYQIGQLAMSLADRYQNLAISAKVKVIIPWFSQPWRQELRNSIPLMDESILAAQESCNLTFLGVSAGMSMLTRFFAGVPLDEIVGKMAEIEKIIIKSKDESSQLYFALLRQTILDLRDKPSSATTITTNENKESSFLSTLYGFRTFSAYIFEDIPNALRYADTQLLYESPQTTGMTKIQIWLFDALTRLAAYPNSKPFVQKHLMRRVSIDQSNLLKRAKLMPGNFQHKVDLIEAERCRVLGKFTEAIELYDLAISGAKTNKYLHEEAIGNELAAKFYLEQGRAKIAATYLQKAYYCYARWGASAKIDDLEQRYPQLILPIIQQPVLILR
jgi:predicted ATPase